MLYQCLGGHPKIFDFSFYAIFASRFVIHFVYLISPCSSPDSVSVPFHDILNLADVADVLVANSVP